MLCLFDAVINTKPSEILPRERIQVLVNEFLELLPSCYTELQKANHLPSTLVNQSLAAFKQWRARQLISEEDASTLVEALKGSAQPKAAPERVEVTQTSASPVGGVKQLQSVLTEREAKKRSQVVLQLASSLQSLPQHSARTYLKLLGHTPQEWAASQRGC